MNKDYWTNTQTQVEYGVNGVLGSPRAWLRRALESQHADDTAFQPGSITPLSISVGGIWYRPLSGVLPDLPHPQLYRFFSIPTPDRILASRTKNNLNLVRAIGIAAAVPPHEILQVTRLYRQAGAAFVWWSWPETAAQAAANPLGSSRTRSRLDHNEVYRRLDLGQNRKQIAQDLGVPTNNIDYVVTKWRARNNGAEVAPTPRPRIDAPALVQDYASGMRAVELALKYNTTEAYVYKLIKQQRCLALNQP